MTEATAKNAKKRTLLDISDDMATLNDLLFEAGGDVSDPQVEQYVAEWMEEIDNDFNTKVDNYCTFIRQLELESAARKEEAERLLKRVKADENTVKSLKWRLKSVMEQRGLKKAGGKRTASVVPNGGKVPVEIDDNVNPEALPPRFQKVTVTLNKDAVRDALAEGEELQFARFGLPGTHLRIR